MRTQTLIAAVLIVVSSYFLALWTGIDLRELLGDILLPFGGALAGIVLATVAIVMGSIGATYTAIATKANKANEAAANKAYSAMDRMVRELKHDCVAVIISFGVMLGVYFLARADIPFLHIITVRYFSKEIVLLTTSIAACLASFLAMIDTLGAVFSLHNHTSTIAKES